MNKRTLYYIGLILLQLYYCTNNIVFAQKLFHQDIFYGGATAGGVSGGYGTGSFDLKLYIEPGSTIKHAYLFAYTIQNPQYVAYTINGEEYFMDTNNVIMNSEFPNVNFNPVKVYYNDVTKEFNENITTDYIITIPEQHNIGLNEGWWAIYVFIEYDNPNLSKIATSLWVNDKDYKGNEMYSMNSMNTIDQNYPIGLSLMTDRSCDTISDGVKIFLNNNYIGIIGGSDAVNSLASCAGAKGHFYYQNNQLYGLDDDVPNVVMSGVDALADISSYLNDNTSYNLQLEYQNQSNISNAADPHLLFINAYTTPCDTFTTSIINDTSICEGGQLMLYASGGTKYDWSPSNGLSDTVSSSPIVSPEKTTLYQVRIENTPGCSKTENVLVKVHQNPKIESLNIEESVCGSTSGHLFVNVIGGSTSLKYSISETFQTNKFFYNLGGGDYTLVIKDTNGCKIDTAVNIPIKNNVKALFTATPELGAKPLSVHFINQSSNASNYQWLVNDTLLSNSTNEDYIFDSSGVYMVTLVAWNNNVSCNDTFKIQIIVYDSLIIQVPNVFTPNNDGVNDFFTVQIEGANQVKGVILNRWGEIFLQFEKSITKNSGTIILWDGRTKDGTNATEGVYFYSIEALNLKEKSKQINGFFHLVR